MRAFNARAVPRPALDPATVDFIADSPALDLEIGAGAGLHAIRHALAHPTRRILAVERTEVKFAGLARRFERHGAPPNLRPLRADAVAVTTHFVREGQLARVFLLYPNPYPKHAQANLRWYNSPFLAELRRKMAPGAELTLATNLAWYAAGARASLPAHFHFVLKKERRLGPGDPPRTHFEKKYLARGELCFDLVFRRE